MGNIKFDYSPHTITPGLRNLLRNWKKNSLLLIADSTMRGEEDLLLETFKQLSSKADIKILIAPRHPDRFDEVYSLAEAKGFDVSRRSMHEEKGNVMILDTIGELAAAYELADVVFMGGTISYGGHNPIEAAFYAKPIVAGPHYENFRAIFEDLMRNQAIVVSSDVSGALSTLIADPKLRERIGSAAQQLIQTNQGATDFVLQNIRKYLDDRSILEPGSKSSVR
jgi:3-deoxy-D-manno-octulosonic-acid transferase